MKHTSIRAFVLVLSLAGLGSSVNAKLIKSPVATPSHTTVNIIPTCAPSDPNHCGMD